MKYALLSLSLLCGFALSACNATYRDADTHVNVNDGHGHGQGTFCPPGQAKKGNC
jgi:hypothetical protein